MSDVRCKFVCESYHVNGPISNRTYSYRFYAVHSGSEENKTYWKYTPGGTLEFQSVNHKLPIEPGQEFYLDLTACTGPLGAAELATVQA